MEGITFRTLRKYISQIDRLSICRKETLEYTNYIFLKEVPDIYDDLFVYGIGMIESEFYEVHKNIYAATGDRENMVMLPCIEIMLSKEPKMNYNEGDYYDPKFDTIEEMVWEDE
jgi:hypothetical protein